ALFEGARDGDGLVDRSRLVDVGDRRVARGRHGGAPVGGGDKVGHGQDLARVRVGHDGDPALGLGGDDLLGQGPFGLVLHGTVDGQDEVVTPAGALHLVQARGDLVTAGVV